MTQTQTSMLWLGMLYLGLAVSAVQMNSTAASTGNVRSVIKCSVKGITAWFFLFAHVVSLTVISAYQWQWKGGVVKILPFKFFLAAFVFISVENVGVWLEFT